LKSIHLTGGQTDKFVPDFEILRNLCTWI